ncbi:MAG TPA: tetraacyldisaccharide 4'-kinase, partial [Chitinophagaceae bacterium]|nr:tetraacyldisaccharide 4'-kinase [Chitinophagaceae bacterium]
MRNRLYDWKVLSSIRFDLPTIAVGNLSVGGAGKSPHVEYLISLLKEDFAVATLSRGYARKTQGYLFATENSTALEIGDEPALFHQKFPEVAVGVGENRVLALPQLLMDAPATQVVILDDAFQHRSIHP